MPEGVALVARLLTGLYVAAAVVSLAVGITAWRRRGAAPTAIGLGVAMAGACAWSLIEGATSASLGGWLPRAAGPATFAWITVPVAVAVAGFWCLGAALAAPEWRATPRICAWLSVHPLTMLVITALPATRAHLVTFPAARADTAWLAWQPGPLFWVHTVVSYALLAWGCLYFLQAHREGGPLQRRQAGTLLAGMLVALLANVPSILLPGTVPELTGVALAMTGVVDAVALFRHGLLDVVPVARSVVFDHMSDAVVVVDARGRVLDLNPAAEQLVRVLGRGLPRRLTGLPVATVLASVGLPVPLQDGEHVIAHGEEEVALDLRSERLHDRRGTALGTVIVARDVTEVHHQRRELATANETLRFQLATIDALRHDLQDLAERDELTGLHNRRYLVGALDAALGRALAHDHDLWVAILDVDHFKSVNDTHGHPTGDALLVGLARALAAGVREGDVTARLGGEEFVVVLPGATEADALARAEQLRQRCAEVSVAIVGGSLRRTVSLGIAGLSSLRAVHSGEGVTAAALLALADRALYAAKAAGRNRVASCAMLAGAHAVRAAFFNDSTAAS